ncbi:MAG: hypothetical protein ABIL09_29855 [Gemmatimonadota bacterium]
MARTLTTLLVDLEVRTPRAALFGDPDWFTTRDRLTWISLSDRRPGVYDPELREFFCDRVELAEVVPFTGVYTIGAAGAAYFATYRRTVPQAKSWVAIELLYREPEPTTNVRFLLGDAGADLYRWNGAAWVVTDPAVSGNWNTEADLVAGFPSWAGTTVRVAFRLATSDAAVTPVVYGARAMCRAWAPSPVEDLVLRTVMPHLATTRAPLRFVEPSDASGVIDLSGMREYRVADVTPVAVHNLTDDPNETVDLFGSWNPGTGRITLTAPQDLGDELLVDLQVAPLVARATHRDFDEISRVPALVIQGVSVVDNPARGVPDRVRDRTALTARQIDRPDELRLLLDVVAVAGYDADLQRLCDAVDDVLGWAYSEVTGEPVSVRRIGDWTLRDGGGARVVDARVSLEAAGMIAYRGADAAALLTDTVVVTAAEAAG